MSETSIDGGTESDQFMSLPATPTAEDGPFFSKGESVHDYPAFNGVFLQRFLEPSSSPVPAHASETSSGPSTSRDSDAANGEESYPEDLYAPIIAGRSPPQSFAASSSHVQVPEPSPPPEDYSCPVKGMYRLLDLITELGSSGLGNRPFLGYQFHELIEF